MGKINEWTGQKEEREEEVKITFESKSNGAETYIVKNKYVKPVREAIRIFLNLREEKKMGKEDICIATEILSAMAKKI